MFGSGVTGLAVTIAVHLGFHCTEEDRLLRCLLRNAPGLAAAGVSVPQPALYRQALRAQAAPREGEAAEPGEGATARLAEVLAPAPGIRRIVLSHPNLVSYPGRAVTAEGLYAGLPARLAALSARLGAQRIEIFCALRNPATLLPALRGLLPGTDYATLMSGLDPSGLRWIGPFARLRAALPDLPVTLWCSEDLPLIWPDLLRRLAGVPAGMALDGDADLLGALLTPVGMATLAAYLKAQGPLGPGDRRRLTTALLERYAQPGALEVEIDLPGWTDALVAEVTERYLADVAAIAALPGVERIAP